MQLKISTLSKACKAEQSREKEPVLPQTWMQGANLLVHVRKQTAESSKRCGGHHIRLALARTPRPAGGGRANAEMPMSLAVGKFRGLC